MTGFPDGERFERAPWAKGDKRFPSAQAGMVGFVKQLIDELHDFSIDPAGYRKLSIESLQFWTNLMLAVKRQEPPTWEFVP